MPTNLDDFYFDVNYGMGTDSVFTLIDKLEAGINPPPAEGYFLLLNGQDFLLLNGQNLALL
jgi:hypothetical protein